MGNKQYITRVVELDIGHRVMHERVKCYSLHGHRVKVELTFLFTASADIGYCIDFKEIKRIGGQWLDDMLDHSFIANPKDHAVIKAIRETDSKYYLMSLAGAGNYCNPTAENIAREIFLAMEILFANFKDLSIYHVRYYETPSCFVDTCKKSINRKESKNFHKYRYEDIANYATDKGIFEYDSRKL